MPDDSFIPVNEPLLEGNEEKYLLECIRTGWISSEGPFIERFEQSFADYIGRKHAIAVTNGTSALDASIEALGIGPGDEVIVPTLTIISCLGQICRCGATPVLVDSDPNTWNMDVSQVESKITNRTKAIMLVHIYGLPVDVDPVLALAKKYDLKVIEDAAEAHGQTYKSKPCGSFGDISTFSFYPNKHVTTGEGGMIACDDDDLAELCRSLRNLCFQADKRFKHERLGWNLRMTNMQAAIGLAQLERLDEFVLKKRRMGARYTELLQGIDGISLPLDRVDYAQNIYWVFGIVVSESINFTAEQVMQKLAQQGIGTRPFFYPMHQQPVFRNMGMFESDRHPVAEYLSRQGFYLPSGLKLSDDQIERSADVLREAVR